MYGKVWTANKDALEARLKIAEANNNQSLHGLREEIRSKDLYIENLQGEHSNVMRQAHKQQEILERDNAALTSTLTMKERELGRVVQSQQQQTAGRENDIQHDLTKLQIQVVFTSNIFVFC